eukprot:328622_1
MSLQQKRSELLILGYASNTYGSIPMPLIKLIQLFYNEYMYWILEDDKLQQFMNANHNCIQHHNSFKINEIEFQILLYSNEHNDGLVRIAIEMKYLPSNIEYVEFYEEMKCDKVTHVIKRLNRTKESNNISGDVICHLSQFKHANSICFSYLINIKHIQYKRNCNKINYYSPITKIHKCYQFVWNINHLLMQKCKNMIFEQVIYSDSFDNHHWCLELHPNGNVMEGQLSLALNCLCLPYKIDSMVVKYQFYIGKEIYQKIETFGDIVTHGICDVMPFIEFKQKKSISVVVILEILSIYEKNDQIIDVNEWRRRGIIQT